jgi:hypothetical protein
MRLCHCCPVKSCQADEKTHCMRLSQKKKIAEPTPQEKQKETTEMSCLM